MKLLLNCFLFFTFFNVFAQETKPVSPMVAVDSLYREDQFYFGFTYNTLINKPDGLTQNKFSSGFSGGFIRDMPFNKKRTWAIAAGLGLSYNKTFQNLLISKNNQNVEYTTIDPSIGFDKNKIDQIFVDVPLELRWRNSTPESTKFWRIYTGVKFSYMVMDKYVHSESAYKTVIKGNDNINKVRLGTYLAAGYNTWNFFVYYGITPIFKSSAKLNGQDISLNSLNFGLMFYIL